MYMKFTFHVQTFVGFGGESFQCFRNDYLVIFLTYLVIFLSIFLSFLLSGKFCEARKGIPLMRNVAKWSES